MYYKVAIFQLELEAGTSHARLVKVTIFQLEPETCTSCARLVLQSCDFPARAGLRAPVLRVLDLYYKVALEPVLRALDWYYKVAPIFELELETCTSCTRLALQSCDFPETCTSSAILLDLYYKVAIFQRVLDF